MDENEVIVRNKARFVAQGFKQIEEVDFDETFGSVARLKSIQILLATTCIQKFKLIQIDVKSAFLNGILNEEFYVGQPKGFQDPRFQVKQLKDGIFLSQSKYAREFVKKFGLESTKHYKTPMASSTKLSKDKSENEVDETLYRSMIGSFLFLIASRLDIAFSVGACASADWAGNVDDQILMIVFTLVTVWLLR
ncbi:hypothetical protein AAG906_014904 [Vitis piasezkii]